MTGMTTLSLIAVPLRYQGTAQGVLEAINKVGDAFDEHDLEMLEALAGSAAIAIENARLYQSEREQFRRLQESQAQLVQVEKMAALGRLVASIAHEINNPLQAMQGSLELAAEELQGNHRPDKLTRYLRVANSEIERLATIVHRLRDFYRPAREGLLPTDVNAVLQSVLELAGKQLQHSHVTVEWAGADALPMIQANPDYLKQVFLNLVLNAIDAMSEQGGTLSVRTTLDQMPGRTGPPLPAVRIEFSDTGDGIPPEMLPHIFEPFVTTKKTGTGLGLSISYGLIEAHNGRITVTSQMEMGSKFMIWLPAARR
jgi:two-component system NtrC family sensor kinase